MMKKTLLLLFVVLSTFACQDDKKSAKEKTDQQELDSNRDSSISSSEEKVEKETSLKNIKNKEELTPNWNGQFLKSDAVVGNSSNCRCNCLDIDFNTVKTLCIDQKSDIDIQVKYVVKENLVQMIYLNGNGNIEDKNPIPWSDFDKNSVVAEITTKGSQLDLDWKGFTINNELATDYAILGKKNLEGTYKRK